MKDCPVDLIDAAASDQLSDDQSASLESHLSKCQACRLRLDDAVASAQWWEDASRLLDQATMDDPSADIADSSAAEARLFEGDDPVGELKAAGVIGSASHPEMLGQLGRYAIEREIGSGGMGVVLKAYDAELNRTVAIKVLAPHLARSGAARQRFVREGRAAAAVVHENVVAIHEVDTSGRLPTLVMRYVDGVSLQRHVDTIGPLPICDALRIAAQTAAGLSAAHRQGIVHRDVKPANILVGGGGGRIWITDFGSARAVDDASLTRTGFIAGTPHYMSPEQARGGSIGPASDLFSLGAVIYFMFAARPPWRAERSLAVLHRIVSEPHRPLWKLNPDVPREVSDLVDRLLAKSPEVRGSANHVQKELERMLSDLQNPGSPHSLATDAGVATKIRQHWISRPMFVVPLTAALTALLIHAPGWIDSSNPTDNGTKVIRQVPIGATATIRPDGIAYVQEDLTMQEQKPFPIFAGQEPPTPPNVVMTDEPDPAGIDDPAEGQNALQELLQGEFQESAVRQPAPQSLDNNAWRTSPGLSMPPSLLNQNVLPVSSSTISDDLWSDMAELESLLIEVEAIVLPTHGVPIDQSTERI